MLNKYTVYYIVLTIFAALISIVGAIVGNWAARRGKGMQSTVERHRFEQRLYLAYSALGLGLVIKLALVPGWFLLLQSLIPSVPGAMCLVGMHQNVPYFSWLSSSLKLFLPMLYLAWLVVGLVDRKFIEQPFMGLRTLLLLPLASLLVVEIGSDLVYLFSLKPVNVSCCLGGLSTAGQSMQNGNVAGGSTLWPWSVAGCTIFLLAILLRPPQAKGIYLLVLLGGLGMPALLVLAYQARQTLVQLPDYFVNKIYHQCIFCLLQANVGALYSLCLLYVGSALIVAISVVFLAGLPSQKREELLLNTKKVRLLSTVSLVTGLVLYGFSF